VAKVASALPGSRDGDAGQTPANGKAGSNGDANGISHSGTHPTSTNESNNDMISYYDTSPVDGLDVHGEWGRKRDTHRDRGKSERERGRWRGHEEDKETM
jgi:hypothetical protein